MSLSVYRELSPELSRTPVERLIYLSQIPELRGAVLPFLYREVVIGGSLPNVYNISQNELLQLSEGRLKFKVDRLHIGTDYGIVDRIKLGDLLRQCSEYIKHIPHVKYKGWGKLFEQHCAVLPMNLVTDLQLYDIGVFRVEVPYRVRKLALSEGNIQSGQIDALRSTLAHVCVEKCQNVWRVPLQPGLRILECYSSTSVWPLYPLKLESLVLLDIPDFDLTKIQFPNLTELVLRGCGISDFRLLQDMLPVTLKRLDLAGNTMTSMEGVVLPPLLEHLNLRNNLICSLDIAELPLLGPLTITF